MVILEDTRNQRNKHRNIHRYFDDNGIEWARTKLYVGDYQIANMGGFAIDTKKDVVELMEDIFHQHERFRRECERAMVAGIRLLILVEERLPDGGLAEWKSPRRRNGKLITLGDPVKLRKAMITMQERYGVRFRFCDPSQTGELIVRHLVREAGL